MDDVDSRGSAGVTLDWDHTLEMGTSPFRSEEGCGTLGGYKKLRASVEYITDLFTFKSTCK